MAKEIQAAGLTSGATYYAIVRKTAGALVWNKDTPGFEALVAGNLAHYALAMAEIAGTGDYTADFPAGITVPDRYEVAISRQAGGSPAWTDTVATGGSIDWTGTAVATIQAANNTGQTSPLPADLQTVKGQTVTAAAGVTFPASVASQLNAPSWYTAPQIPPTAAAITTAVVAAMATAPVGSVAAGVTLAAGGLDAVIVEAGLNARQALSLNAAALDGVLSGAGTGTITIKGAGVATTRIVATTDTAGNRSVVTLTPPA
jgi:hypothetical protein